MAANAVQFRQLGVAAHRRNSVGELTLLFHREQNIRPYTDDQCPVQL